MSNNQVSSLEEPSKSHTNVCIAWGMAEIPFGPPKHEAWQKEVFGVLNLYTGSSAGASVTFPTHSNWFLMLHNK